MIICDRLGVCMRWIRCRMCKAAPEDVVIGIILVYRGWRGGIKVIW